MDDGPPLRLDSRHDRVEPLVAGAADPLLGPFCIAASLEKARLSRTMAPCGG